MLTEAKNDKNYILPTNKQITDYMARQNITDIVSIDAIDNHYVNILYKIGQDGVGFKVVTSLFGNKVITIADGKTIYDEKIPEVVIGGSGGRVNFKYIYLNDPIARMAKEIKVVYYDDEKKENIEISEMVNNRKCFIYAEPKYNNILEGFQSISIYGENGEELNTRQ
jgi:hypothetical protein